jgi:phosphate uptake regulator
MEIRKVQRTGKSTFVVSIPKSWATINGLKIGSIIYISEGDSGTLNLSADRSEKNLEIKLDIGNKTGEPLARDIIGCYIAGYKTIEISSSRMSASQKKDLHKIVNKLLGPEILEESNNKVIIQDLLDSEELQVEKALKRMKTMVLSMIHDGMTALLTGDRDLASDVIQRDDDVDRLNLLISRQFAGILRYGSVGKRNHSIIVALNYMQAASNLERIADHALRIAQIAGEYSNSLPDKMADELLNLRSIFSGLIDESISALLQGDCDKANKIIDQAKEARMRSHNMANASEIKDKEALLVRLVAASSSIERIIDYIINISELTINLRNSDLETEESRLNRAPKICHKSVI